MTRVSATDNGRVGTIRYEMIGEAFTPAFFSLNEQSGSLTLITNLKDDGLERTEYKVND